MAPRGSGAADNQQVAAVAAVLTLMVALFVGAYRWGSSWQGEDVRRGSDLRQTGDYLRDQLKVCRSKTHYSLERTTSFKGESGVLWQGNRQLEEENERLVRLNEELEKKSIECVENNELQKQTWSEEDQKAARELAELDRRNKELRFTAKRLSSAQGMRTILLLASIRKLAEENRRLRQKLELPSVEPSDEYIAGLVEKWRRVDKALTEAGETGPMSDRAGEVLKPNGTEFSQLLRRPKLDWQLDHRHAALIFWQTKGPDGEYVQPSWLGRVGTPKLQHGVLVGQQFAPIMDIARQLRVLYEYALCAMGNNLTEFMYPTGFRTHSRAAPESLHDYLETPLVSFCDECRPQHNSAEFKLLCQGFSSEDQYGSPLFWRMRSRLRFRSSLLKRAERWMEDSGFGGVNRTLAVRLKRGDFEEKCQMIRSRGRPQLSFLRLLRGRVRESSTSFDNQCFPGTEHVIRTINDVCGAKRIERVFLTTDAAQNEVDLIRSRVKVPVVVHRPTHRNYTHDTILEIVVASSMRYAILNRFDIQSTHIGEYFLLANRLQGSRLMVW
eukprot:TRINITY_DN36_c0_g1_i1.p1 TRINITY_DN36_c0_g1~~TRINITY_DN36_c0_g1_i1.p1  ORF type:complete len:595 (+),score=254.01 TRINITY_DN36_c0_g1_i1:126-1787(+)